MVASIKRANDAIRGSGSVDASSGTFPARESLHCLDSRLCEQSHSHAETIAGAWTAFVSSGAATAVAGGAATAVILSVPGDTAKDKDKAKTDTDVMTRTRERDCKCPADRGTMGPVNHSMPQLSAQYQQYVTGFPRGMEWIYMNKDFDGFQSSQCLLQEAKANYEFFFENNGKPNFMFLRGKGPKNHGKVKNRPAYERTRDQARGQSDIVRSSPPAKLNWYFMQLKFYTWATAEFAENGYAITMQFKPMNINQRVLR